MHLFKGTLCKLFFCALLGAASIGGVNMRPEEIEDLMHRMNQPVIAHTLKEDAGRDDD